jgi:hypothetical protein
MISIRTVAVSPNTLTATEVARMNLLIVEGRLVRPRIM